MKEDGGPAFPCGNTPSEADGMTLRDYFAAAALNLGQSFFQTRLGEMGPEKIAETCGLIADAMLAERSKACT